jgi:hypothetical protein
MNEWISHISFTFGRTKTSDSLSPLNEWMNEFHTFHSHLGLLKQATPCRHLMNEWMNFTYFIHILGILKTSDSLLPLNEWMNEWISHISFTFWAFFKHTKWWDSSPLNSSWHIFIHIWVDSKPKRLFFWNDLFAKSYYWYVQTNVTQKK